MAAMYASLHPLHLIFLLEFHLTTSALPRSRSFPFQQHQEALPSRRRPVRQGQGDLR
jgi:hypothetical protein